MVTNNMILAFGIQKSKTHFVVTTILLVSFSNYISLNGTTPYANLRNGRYADLHDDGVGLSPTIFQDYSPYVRVFRETSQFRTNGQYCSGTENGAWFLT